MSRKDLTSDGVIAKTLNRKCILIMEVRVSGKNAQKTRLKTNRDFALS